MATSKKIKSKLIILGVLAIVSVCVFPYVKKVSKTVEGVKWENQKPLFVEKSEIQIDGYVKKYLFRKDRFIGSIAIEGNKCVFDDNYKNSNYIFSNKLEILNFLNNKGEYEQFGYIKSDSSFKNIFIAVTEKDEINSNSWSITDGMVICAPAKTRVEAIELANKIFSNS